MQKFQGSYLKTQQIKATPCFFLQALSFGMFFVLMWPGLHVGSTLGTLSILWSERQVLNK